MQKTTADGNRTARLLALFKQGDSAFNDRNQAGMDAVHHPDMIAHIPGYPKPIYGAAAHAKAMQQFIEIFPDIRVYNDPYRVQFGSGDWITTITRTTGTFTGKMVLPDGKVVPPTGKAFDLPDFVQVVKFEGDRVIEIYAVWDSGLFASQIGLA